MSDPFKFDPMQLKKENGVLCYYCADGQFLEDLHGICNEKGMKIAVERYYSRMSAHQKMGLKKKAREQGR